MTRKRGALVITLLLATILRLASLSRESLWLDEAISFLTAQLAVSKILRNAIQDPHPPFYYLILHYWLDLDLPGDALLRLPDVFWSILLIPVIYQLGRSLFRSADLGLIGSFIIAVSPFHVFYSHELRMYSLLMLLTSAFTLCYLKARETMKWAWWLAFGALALLAIYTHVFAFLVLAGLGLHTLVKHHERATSWRTALVILSLLILFIPWLALISQESEYALGSLRPLARSVSGGLPFLKLLTTLTFLLFSHSTTFWYSALAMFLTISLIVIGVIELVKSRRAGGGSAGLLLPVLIVACSVGIPVVIHTVRPFFLPERTMSAAAPVLALAMAWATTRRNSPLPYLVVASTVFMLVGTLIYHSSSPQKPPYRAMAAFLSEQRRANDVILHTSDGSYLPALRYTQFPQHGLLQGDPDPRKPRTVYSTLGGDVWARDEAIQLGNRLWLIVAREHSVGWQEEQLAYFNANFQRLDAHDIGGITINLYAIDDP